MKIITITIISLISFGLGYVFADSTHLAQVLNPERVTPSLNRCEHETGNTSSTAVLLGNKEVDLTDHTDEFPVAAMAEELPELTLSQLEAEQLTLQTLQSTLAQRNFEDLLQHNLRHNRTSQASLKLAFEDQPIDPKWAGEEEQKVAAYFAVDFEVYPVDSTQCKSSLCLLELQTVDEADSILLGESLHAQINQPNSPFYGRQFVLIPNPESGNTQLYLSRDNSGIDF